MFCEKCGAKNPDGATFCSQCGAPCNTVKKPDAAFSGGAGFGAENNAPKIPHLAAVIALAVGLIGWIFLPWIGLSAYGESESFGFFDCFDSTGPDGDWFMIFFLVSVIFVIFSIVALLVTLKKKNIGKINSIVGILGIASFLCMMFEVNSDVYDAAKAWGIDVGIGFGVWLMFIAGIGLIAMRVLNKKK